MKSPELSFLVVCTGAVGVENEMIVSIVHEAGPARRSISERNFNESIFDRLT